MFPDCLRLGSRGAPVVMLQLILVAHKCNEQRIVVDGEFGRETLDGVKSLQVDLEVPVNGCFDLETRSALAELRDTIPLGELPARFLLPNSRVPVGA